MEGVAGIMAMAQANKVVATRERRHDERSSSVIGHNMHAALN